MVGTGKGKPSGQLHLLYLLSLKYGDCLDRRIEQNTTICFPHQTAF